MSKSFYNVIGVMSGTSLDGIDLAHIHFQKTDTWSYELFETRTIPYSDHWHDVLGRLTETSLNEIRTIDKEYTKLLSEVINEFISVYDIKSLDAICSHGHTALHQPENGLTYQIGNLPELATLTKHTIICDFRTQDVRLGGQGAPLVPIGDQLLFSNYDACLNLGGFANVSFQKNGKRIAYDICPANIVLNTYAKSLGHDFDSGGQIAKTGELQNKLLSELNSLSYYHTDPPKSLGLEWVQKNVIPLIEGYQLSGPDVLHTFSHHIAFQLSRNFSKDSKVLITGGGAYNDYLMELLGSYKNLGLVIPSKALIEYKEALIFGFLGVLKLRNEINCLASVTGATKNHSSGVVYVH